MIDFYEEHREHRRLFEVLAFHDASAKSFAELDPKLATFRANLWKGRDLPFPVLLDATGATIKAYGITAFPTTVLIDPQGKLVGEGDEEELAKHLPTLPMAHRISRALDRVTTIAFEETPLDKGCAFLSRLTRLDIHVRRTDLARLHIKPDVVVPLQVDASITLRSWLELMLGPFGLTYEPDDTGLAIVASKAERARQPRDFELAIVKRVEAALKKKIDFDFKNASLADVAEHLSKKTGEGFAVDPWARHAGRLDPALTVTGSAHQLPVREALRKVLEPSGLTFVVRDEIVVIRPREPNWNK